jgi:hypothetical protein
MSAAGALKAARAAGIGLGIDGNALMLEASAAPPPAVIELLSRHKAEIVALLRPPTVGWSVLDWRTFFAERVRVAAVNGLKGIDAEARAFGCCVVEWLNRNPVCSPSGCCLGCGGSEHGNDKLLPFGNEPAGHAWLHSRCWASWRAGRKAEAVAALAKMGIQSEGLN